MKNFYKIGDGFDVGRLLLAIHRHDKSSGIWKADTYLRQYPQGPLGDCESIILRFPPIASLNSEDDLKEFVSKNDQHECVDFEPFKLLIEAKPIVFGLMSFVNGERLGRVVINKLKPGGVIYPHKDGTEHSSYYDRFHVVLQSSPGVVFRAGNEQVYMETGSAWWFDNSIEHEVINNSATDRIHMVIDIRTSK